jgi:hypothetical protein
MTKRCSTCKLERSIEDYAYSYKHLDKRQYTCKFCKQQYYTDNKEKYKKYNTEKTRTRSNNHKLQYKFNISRDDFNRKLEQQSGVCAICKQPETNTYRGKVRNLSVDHCHVTNKLRDLLCRNCNTALGSLKDDKQLILECIKYLERHGN